MLRVSQVAIKIRPILKSYLEIAKILCQHFVELAIRITDHSVKNFMGIIKSKYYKDICYLKKIEIKYGN